MTKWRKLEANEFSNGVIRSVNQIKLYELEVFTFGSNEWHEKFAVCTNIGVLLFDDKNHKLAPQLISYDKFVIQLNKDNEVTDGKRNLFTMYTGEEEQKTYSARTKDEKVKFAARIEKMYKEYKKTKKLLAGNPTDEF